MCVASNPILSPFLALCECSRTQTVKFQANRFWMVHSSLHVPTIQFIYSEPALLWALLERDIPTPDSADNRARVCDCRPHVPGLSDSWNWHHYLLFGWEVTQHLTYHLFPTVQWPPSHEICFYSLDSHLTSEIQTLIKQTHSYKRLRENRGNYSTGLHKKVSNWGLMVNSLSR